MEIWVSEADARARLIRKVHEHGSAMAFAKAVGCSPALVSYVMNGHKNLGPKLAKALGLIAVPVVTYRYLETDAATTKVSDCR